MEKLCELGEVPIGGRFRDGYSIYVKTFSIGINVVAVCVASNDFDDVVGERYALSTGTLVIWLTN